MKAHKSQTSEAAHSNGTGMDGEGGRPCGGTSFTSLTPLTVTLIWTLGDNQAHTGCAARWKFDRMSPISARSSTRNMRPPVSSLRFITTDRAHSLLGSRSVGIENTDRVNLHIGLADLGFHSPSV